jgi:L-ascorbate metabolism protein UlaG (beta-lactamase superfamily)
MKIQKFLHSCLLVEDNGARILIDPSSWSFGEGACKISDVPKVDAILITHQHQDHFTPDVIKQFVARDHCAIYANEELVKLMAENGITATTVGIPSTVKIGNVTVSATVGPHGRLPYPGVLNNGFYINDRFYTPGDCHTFEPNIPKVPEVLAMPIMAPWGTFTEAVDIVLRLKPKHVIPVHDMIIAERLAPRLITMMGEALAKAGIQFHPLKPGEILEI